MISNALMRSDCFNAKLTSMDDQQCREAIEARLAVLGWSRAELARRAGYAASSITNLLNDTREFGEGPRLRLGVALGIDLGTRSHGSPSTRPS